MSRMTIVKANKTWLRNEQALGEIDKSPMQELKRETLSGMAEALEDVAARARFTAMYDAANVRMNIHIQKRALTGDPQAAAEAVDKADALLAEAIAYDPRLCKRAQWTRGEDGLFADAGLVASGDDAPCYDRTRARLGDVAEHGEPVKVVISTDGTRPDPANLVAFAAVARIVMQFRPLEIYQQGAWLNDNGTDTGYVFFVPLVANTFDLARLQYALTDSTRDGLSFAVFARRCEQRDRHAIRGLGRHADRSYMAGAHFVPRTGIKADAYDVARVAASWLGIESAYWTEREELKKNGSALQELPKAEPVYIPETAAERAEREKRWQEDDKARAKRRAEEAQKRMEEHAA